MGHNIAFSMLESCDEYKISTNLSLCTRIYRCTWCTSSGNYNHLMFKYNDSKRSLIVILLRRLNRLRIYMRSYWLRNNVHFFNHRHHLRVHGRHPPLHLEAQVCVENLDRQDSREGLQPQPCSLPRCIR